MIPTRPLFHIALAVLGLGVSGMMAAEPAPATASAQPSGVPDAWLPSTTAFVFHSSKPDPVLELLLDPAVTKQISLEKGPAAVLTGIARYFQTQAGSDWKTALHRMMRRGFTLAAGPAGAVVLMTHAEDGAFLEKLNGALVKVGSWGGPQKVQEVVYANTTCWTVSEGKQYHAIVGDWLFYSNQLSALQQVLDLRAGTRSVSDSLAGNPDYLRARHAASSDTAAVVLAAPALAHALPWFKRDANATQQPMGVLLLGRTPQAAQEATSEWLTLSLDVNQGALTARAAGERLAGQVATFALPPGKDGALPNVTVPRQIAGLSLWRDLHAFYAAKDTLFPERTSALILFENMMGIYFSGRDLTEDVMGALDPHVRLVVAEQAYDPQTGTPSVKMPAFALVFRMRDPQRFGPIIEEAWQKALGLINFTRGQKAQPGLIMDKRDHGGVRYTFAAFSAAEEPDKTKLDVRFNFRPAIVRAGESLILSSTEQLADDLIDALHNPAPAVVASNSLIEVDGARLATILLANRESIVRGNMLKKGQERSVAEKELNHLTSIAQLLGQATLRTGEAASQPFVDLKLELPGVGAGH